MNKKENAATTAKNGVRLEKPYDKSKVLPQTETAAQTLPTEKKEDVLTPEISKNATIEELQKRLKQEIERLNKKTVLAEQRQRFMDCLESLKTYIQELKQDEAFETKNAKIVFQVFGNETGYSSRQAFNDMFSISNTSLILRFCEMLINEVKQKIAELENQLLEQ